jgi:hypothetical protein
VLSWSFGQQPSLTQVKVEHFQFQAAPQALPGTAVKAVTEAVPKPAEDGLYALTQRTH